MKCIWPLFCLVLGVREPAQAASPDCAVALAFGLDISISVDEVEHTLQRKGLAAALLDPAVSDLILSERGAVVLLAYEWSGARGHQDILIPWTRIMSLTDLKDFAATLVRVPRHDDDLPTGLGAAIGFGAVQLDRAPPCARKVLDISGDGIANDGYPPHNAYRHFPVADITVNGLVVRGAEAGVVEYYLREVIHGPGAFVEVAGGYDDYARAMQRKLLRELRPMEMAAQ